MIYRLKPIIYMMLILLVFAFWGAFATQNNQTQGNVILTAAEKTSWFEQGNPNAKHELYVIAEPNCSACHYLYQSIRPYIGNGTLKVRWIMVAFLKPSSLSKAATIISSRNPANALDNDESNFNAATETGGIVPADNIYSDAKAAILENTTFMRNSGFKRTPIIIFKSTARGAEILRGAPQQNQWLDLLPFIGKYH